MKTRKTHSGPANIITTVMPVAACTASSETNAAASGFLVILASLAISLLMYRQQGRCWVALGLVSPSVLGSARAC